jgi:hypothetical protein
MSMMQERAVCVVLLCMFVPTAGCSRWRDSGPKGDLVCLNNLRVIGKLLLEFRESGRLRVLEGAEFLLQVRDELTRRDQIEFVCPADPSRGEFLGRLRDMRCSYRGPDIVTATSFVRGDCDPMTVVACDACGDQGTTRFHRNLIVVLYASGESGAIPWEELPSSGAFVGQSASVEWLRHLVR